MGNAKKVILSMGFVSIPTRIEVAVDKDGSGKDVHTVCTGTDVKHEATRVKQTTGCPTCDRVESSAFAYSERGTQRDGKMVVLSPEELAGASGTPVTGKPDAPAVLKFHPRKGVFDSTLAADSVQYVTPDKGGEKGYALLRDALQANPDVVACMIWAPSTKNALWVFEVVNDRIMVSKRCLPEDVRPQPAVGPVEVADVESSMFQMMVDAALEDFDLAEYADTSRAKLADLIASKIATAPAASGSFVNTTGDIMAAIQATLDASTKAKPTSVPRKRAARKATTKKAAAPRKRAAAKVA